MKCHMSLCTFIAVVGAACLVPQAQGNPATDMLAEIDAKSDERLHIPSPRPGAHVFSRATNPVALSKPMDNSSATCNDFYDVQGGARYWLQGRYSRGPSSMNCNGASVYIQNASNPFYLYASVLSNGNYVWQISGEDNMKGCTARALAYMFWTGCSCPTDPGCLPTCAPYPTDGDCSTTCAQRTCKDSCGNPARLKCLGYSWYAYTGVNAGGSEPPECNADSWCVSGIWLS